MNKIIFLAVAFFSVVLHLSARTIDSVMFGTLQRSQVVEKQIFTGGKILSATLVSPSKSYSISLIDSASGTITIICNSPQNLIHRGALFVKTVNGIKAIQLLGEVHYSDNFDDITFNKIGKPLYDALSASVQNHTAQTYAQARNYMFETMDKLPGDTLVCVYSGKKIKAATRTIAQNLGFNTEHTWPQSRGAENDPPQSDLNHLYITDAPPNAERGNYPFGNVVSGVNYTAGESKRGLDANGNVVFEVPNKHKGNVARSLFYFAIRYSNPTNFLGQGNQEKDMLKWHKFDTVDTAEYQRSLSIATLQGKWNPFVIHPEFTDRIASICCGADFAPVAEPVLDDASARESCTQPAVIHYTNSGNSSLDISSVTLDGAAGQSVIDVRDSTIFPGQVGEISISLNVPSGSTRTCTIQTKNGKILSVPLVCGTQTSVNESSDERKSSFVLSPNPAQDVVEIHNFSQKPLSVKIINMFGQVVNEQVVDGVVGQIQVAEFSSGIYTVVTNFSQEKLVIVR